jgi:hypothetical protein
MYGFEEVTNLGTKIEASAKIKDRSKIKLLLEELSTFLKTKK